jgi:hypothetical protein
MKTQATVLALAAVFALAAPAKALFEVKDPLTKMFNTGSRAVLVGTISGFDAQKNVLSVKPFSAYKGTAPQSDAVLIQISSPESLRKEVTVGEPIVLFVGLRTAAVHVADHWYSAQALGKPHLFNINAPLGHAAHTSHDESFPGKTAALVKALAEIKAGKSTLLDVAPDKLIATPVKASFTLPANATGFAAMQLPGQKTPNFFVATAAGLQVLGADGKPAKDRFGLDGLKPTLLAAGTVDGKPVLLVDSDLYTFDNGGFKKSATLKLPADKILALAMDDLNDDGKAAVAVLTPKSLLRIPLASLQSGTPVVDDDVRLVGNKITEYHREHESGFAHATMAAVELNADHRPDLVILTDTGTLTLVNRGFGAFLVHKTAADALVPSPPSKAPLVAATPGMLYTLHPDGTVYEVALPQK